MEMGFKMLAVGLCLCGSACGEIFSRGYDPSLSGEDGGDEWSWDESQTEETTSSVEVGEDLTQTMGEESESTTVPTTDETSDDADTEETGSSSGEPEELDCQELKIILRDFSDAHADFEVFAGEVAYPGIVASEIGADHKPVYAHNGPTLQTSGPLQFAQWYNDGESNQTFEEIIRLSEQTPGFFSYSNHEFFPIDNQGWGNENRVHNFHFTSEIHAQFDYLGGETITFGGDDDMWLFINGKLAVDLGGLHPEMSTTIHLDEMALQLEIEVGNRYSFEIFHAERHTEGSNFIFETSIDCLLPSPFS